MVDGLLATCELNPQKKIADKGRLDKEEKDAREYKMKYIQNAVDKVREEAAKCKTCPDCGSPWAFRSVGLQGVAIIFMFLRVFFSE